MTGFARFVIGQCVISDKASISVTLKIVAYTKQYLYIQSIFAKMIKQLFICIIK